MKTKECFLFCGRIMGKFLLLLIANGNYEVAKLHFGKLTKKNAQISAAHK